MPDISAQERLRQLRSGQTSSTQTTATTTRKSAAERLAEMRSVPAAEPAKPTFKSRIGEATQERAGIINDAAEAYGGKQQGAARTVFQIGGQLVGGAIDPFVVGAQTAASKLPEFIKKPIRSTIGAVAQGYDAAIKPAVEAISDVPAVQEFAGSPKGASLERDIKAGQEYANVFVPAAKPGVLGPIVKKGQEAIQQTATKISESTATKQISRIGEEVDSLFKQSRGIEGKVRLGDQKNVPLREIVSDPSVFRGLKVEEGSINPDQAIDVLDNRIDALLTAKAKALPEFDRMLPKIPRDVLRADAVSRVKGTVSPADEEDIIAAINRQIDALPNEMSITELDNFRARFRQSARDARGLQKRNSEYAALENSTRDLIFKSTDNLPFDTNKEFASLNTYVKNMIETRSFLDKTIRGQKVKGGRLGMYTGRIIGAVAGINGGLLGSMVGSEIGGAIANVLTNNQLGSGFKMKLIKNLTDDPAIIKEVEAFLKQVTDYRPPALPAGMPGGPRSSIYGNTPIPMTPETPSSHDAKQILRIQEQPNVMKMKETTPPLLLPAKGQAPIPLPSRIQQAPKTQEQIDAEYGRSLKK